MKHTISALLMLLGVIGCSSNSEEPEIKVNVSCSPTEVNLGHEAGSATIAVTADREWTAYSNNAWIKCDIEPTHVNLAIEANPTDEERKGEVVVKSADTRIRIPVTQQGKPMQDIAPSTQLEGNYKLVWNDEFDSGTEPNTSLWWYETGGGGWGNNELQHYVKGSVDGAQLAEVNNGMLNIHCQKIGSTVYSIRINTQQSWKYGYFEARLRLPKGKGTWPAFWMMPKNFTAWPDDGEIDIMEEVGYNPNYVSSSIHCKSFNHGIGTQKTKEILVPTAQEEFHIYALEWTEDYIRTYVDGKELFYFPNDKKGDKNTWPFNAPFYLKLNLAWGGNWGGAQGIDESALPALYQIDYVRVFQKK